MLLHIVTLNWSHIAPDSKLIEGDVEFIVYASVNESEISK